MFGKTAFGPLGYSDGSVDIDVFNRSGALLVQGEPCQLNIVLTGAETTSFAFGGENSAYSNVIAADAAAGPAIAGIVLATAGIADNAKGKIRIYGKVDALQVRTTGNLTPGQLLFLSAGELDGDTADVGRPIGWSEIPASAVQTTVALTPCFFVGWGLPGLA